MADAMRMTPFDSASFVPPGMLPLSNRVWISVEPFSCVGGTGTSGRSGGPGGSTAGPEFVRGRGGALSRQFEVFGKSHIGVFANEVDSPEFVRGCVDSASS